MTRSTTLMSRLRRMGTGADRGSALVMTMLVLAVLSGLGTTVFVLSSRNLKNAQRDRQATAALADAEAGVAQAVAYMKANGVGGLLCSPACASNPWGNSTNPQVVTLATGETYRVWIERIQPFIPGKADGRYRVHSAGMAGSGPGTRTVWQDVSISPFGFPLAVYGDQIDAGGTGQILTESLFTAGCVFKRSKLQFSGVDPVYNIPSAAHSNSIITDDQTSNNNTSCPTTNNKNVHANGVCNDPAYPWDQDSQGGALNGTTCYHKTLGSSDPSYPETSFVNDVAKTYGFQQTGLTSAQIDMLRTTSQEQGFYFTNTWQIPTVLRSASTAINYPHPVLFYELQGSGIVGQTVDLSQLDSTTYGRPTPVDSSSTYCNGRNFILVVLNGNVKLNSNSVLVGSVFAMGPDPNGIVQKANGTTNLIGTIYARHIDLTGTANVNLDDCFLQNLPGNLLNIRPSDFREVDRP